VLVGVPSAEGIYQLSISALDRPGRSVQSSLLIAISSPMEIPSFATRTASAHVTSLNYCRKLDANTSYQLQRDIGIEESAPCLQLSGPNIHIDLGGHSVRGRIVAKAIDINGITIENGSVICNFADTETDYGCIELIGDAGALKPVQIRNLIVRQLSTTTDNAARAVHIDWRAATNSLPPNEPAVRISGLTASVSTSKGPRSPVLGIQGANISVESDHNQLQCPAGSNACQGIVCYGVHACWVHANRIILSPNPHIDETARAILFDEMHDHANDFGEAWNNLIVANEGRAFRIRGSYNVWVHDNQIESAQNSETNSNYVAAIHLGDPDSGTDDLKDARVFHNTISISRGGIAIFARNALNAVVENNMLKCRAACDDILFASVRSPLVANDESHLTLRNNVGIGITLQTEVERGAELNICNSGSAAGIGQIYRFADCSAGKSSAIPGSQ
jgi:hypothetical protein